MLAFNDSKILTKQSKGRPGGGWDDDTTEEINGDKILFPSGGKQTTYVLDKAGSSNKYQGDSEGQGYKINVLDAVKVNEEFLKAHGYENKLINDTIQLGGVRIKQADRVLEDFVKAAETLDIIVVGSILLHKIRAEDLTFINRARILYDIESLVKTNQNYQAFFKQNQSIFKQVTSDFKDSNQNNATLFKNLADSIFNTLNGISSPKTTQIKSTTQLTSNLMDSIEGLETSNSPTIIQNNVSQKNPAFKFIHSQNKEEKQQQQAERATEVKQIKETIPKTIINTNSKKIDAFSFNNHQNPTKPNSQPTNYLTELSNLDFSSQPSVFQNSQQKTVAGSRLDALWSEQNHFEGAIDCMKQLNALDEKNKKQQKEIEDKFFGFVSF